LTARTRGVFAAGDPDRWPKTLRTTDILSSAQNVV
jgi:hypothetical protein